jgi:hypothetical protein
MFNNLSALWKNRFTGLELSIRLCYSGRTRFKPIHLRPAMVGDGCSSVAQEREDAQPVYFKGQGEQQGETTAQSM